MKPFATVNQHQETISNYMYLGLLPFLTCALSPWVFADLESIAVGIFFIYSTIIFSFLAGILWAAVLFSSGEHQRRHLHVAIIFSLTPLAAYFLSGALQIGLMLMGFLSLLFWEKCFINHLYPSWYQQLRHKITYIVVACHMLTIWNIIRI